MSPNYIVVYLVFVVLLQNLNNINLSLEKLSTLLNDDLLILRFVYQNNIRLVFNDKFNTKLVTVIDF